MFLVFLGQERGDVSGWSGLLTLGKRQVAVGYVLTVEVLHEFHLRCVCVCVTVGFS